MRRFAAVPVLLLFTASLYSQTPQWSTSACNQDQGNTSNWGWGHQERACELRRTLLPVVGDQVNVVGTDGGIEVVGEDRKDIALEVRITAYAPSKDKAEQLARQVKIITGSTIRDEGPHTSGFFTRSGYSVNYSLHVPRHLSGRFHTENGGVEAQGLDGVLHPETTNGGLTLKDLAGDVHASTVNGGVHVVLTGEGWSGAGLSASSTNGGISVTAPDGYSAHLIAKTVNGGINVGFPVTVQGTITIKNDLDTNLGKGGPIIHLQTVNGGISISKK
jgi:DUF4097 and DUF4098 domain-containing protein YvlB